LLIPGLREEAVLGRKYLGNDKKVKGKKKEAMPSNKTRTQEVNKRIGEWRTKKVFLETEGSFLFIRKSFANINIFTSTILLE